MTFDVSFEGFEGYGDYLLRFKEKTTDITLEVNHVDFAEMLDNLFKESPDDFRDVVWEYLTECGEKYFENNPISDDEKERFYEILGNITDYEYEDD